MRTSTEVLIVGGGPVGLTLASQLQRRGIDHLIIDERPRPDYFCKALGITPRTLEVWEQMGVLEAALRRGRFMAGVTASINRQQTGIENVELGAMPYGFLMLAQYDTEEMLREHLARHGGRVEQGVRLTDFEPAASGYVARVTTAAGERSIDCRYLAGCDGAHSTVRKRLGLEYQGDSYPMTFMLGDVRVQWDRSHAYGHRFTLLVDGELQNVLVCIPIPGDPQRYRISMAAPPEYADEHADLGTPPTLEQLAQAVAPMLPDGARIADLRWSSFYRISHRIVGRYSSGCAFLVGDAAHIHPPIGGQGMNTGIQDAHNLAWKLELAVRGRAAAALLDSYDAERRPVGQAVVERTTHRMDTTLAAGDVKFDQWMEDSQLLVGYRTSAWVGEDLAAGEAAPGPHAGDRAPHVDGLRREWVARPVRLAELLGGGGHVLLMYFDREAGDVDCQSSAQLADALQSSSRDDIAVYGIVHPETTSVDSERVPILTDADGSFRRSYGAERSGVYLVRPDGYVGYRSDSLEPTRLRRYLGRVFAS